MQLSSGWIYYRARRAPHVRRAGDSVTQLAVDLAVAWGSCRKATERHSPGALERREPDSEGYWLHLTGGKITGLVHMPARVYYLG